MKHCELIQSARYELAPAPSQLPSSLLASMEPELSSQTQSCCPLLSFSDKRISYYELGPHANDRNTGFFLSLSHIL